MPEIKPNNDPQKSKVTIRPKNYKPKDFVRGKWKKRDDVYTGWRTEDPRNGTPTLGKGKGGPGTPYREIKRKSKGLPFWHPDSDILRKKSSRSVPKFKGLDDAKKRAIARRLGS